MDKLELKDILGAIDLNAKTLYDELNEEQKKSIPFFILNRFISNVKSNNKDIQEHFVLAVNEYYNKNYFSLYQHPKLQWLLLCCCAYETKKPFYHEYIKVEKEMNPKLRILEKLYPKHKLSDLEAMSKINTLKDIMLLAGDHGWDEKKIKESM